MINSTTQLSEAIRIFEDESQHDRLRWEAAEHIVSILNDLARDLDLDTLVNFDPDNEAELQEESEALEQQLSDLETQLADLRNERDNLEREVWHLEALAREVSEIEDEISPLKS